MNGPGNGEMLICIKEKLKAKRGEVKKGRDESGATIDSCADYRQAPHTPSFQLPNCICKKLKAIWVRIDKEII